METGSLTHVRECTAITFLEFAKLFRDKTKAAASRTLILKGGELSVFSDFIFEEARTNKRISREKAELYCEEVIDIYRSFCEGINSFFEKDELYNQQINELETSPLEGPDPLSIYSIYSPTDFGIFFNKLFLYVSRVLRVYGKQGQAPETIQQPGTKAEQIMLIHYSGLYQHLYNEHKTHAKASKIIAAIIGGEPATINRIRNFISDPANAHRNNPFKDTETIKSLRRKLTTLEIDTAQFERDLLRSQKTS